MDSSLKFSVRRREALLVAPAKPTPHEFKLLSDIDDQQGLRFHVRFIQVYSNEFSSSMTGRDPAGVIRDALAEALVFYYPFAGRIREGDGRKLVVECTGEGVVFIEADADASVEQLGDALQPPFPSLEEILYDVPGTEGITNSPLVLVQVTRLTCGGFFFAIRFNHTMCDAQGIVQFMSAIGELARGASAPSLLPVWERHIFSARNPPSVTFAHHEYDHVAGTITPRHHLLHRSIFFGPRDIAALRSHLPPHLRNSCSTFDLLTACLWRCRTRALQLRPDEQVRMICVVTARDKFQPPIPEGFYGNTFAFAAAMARAGELCGNPVTYAVEKVRRAKDEVTAEYMQSVADLMRMSGRPHIAVVGSWVVTDLRYVKFGSVDFGWGKALYSGPGDVGTMQGVSSFYIPLTLKKNNKEGGGEGGCGGGEDWTVATFCLPRPAMDRFAAEIQSVTATNKEDDVGSTTDRTPNSINSKI